MTVLRLAVLILAAWAAIALFAGLGWALARKMHRADLQQARDIAAALEARNAAGRALHKPYYGPPDGPKTLHTVLVYCPDYEGCDGTYDQQCAEVEHEALDGHELPACVECQGFDPDAGGATYPLWPCPTDRALQGGVTP